MSGLQELATPGYPATAVDVARIGTAAATADEIAEEMLLDHTTRLNGYSVGIVPILPDYYVTGVAAPQVNLVLPLPGGFLNVQPCHVSVAASPGDSTIPEQAMASIHALVGPNSTADQPDVITSQGGLSGTLRVPTSSPQMAAGDAVHPRIDVLYLTITRSVTFSKSRRVKDPVSGAITTQVVALATDVTFTLGIVQGTPASSPTVPAIPTSSGTAWNVALANIAVPTSYSFGTPVSPSNISQVWRRLWLAPGRTRTTTPGSIMGTAYVTGSDGRSSARMDSQWGAGVAREGVIQHLTSGTTFTLDSSVDWRRRVLRFEVMQVVAVGGVSMPLETTTAGGGPLASASSGPQWSPGAAGPIWIYSPGSPAVTLTFSSTSTGALTVTISTSPVNTGGDVWYLKITGSDRFTA